MMVTLKLLREVIRSSSSAVAVEALVVSGSIVVWDCLGDKIYFLCNICLEGLEIKICCVLNNSNF